MFTPQYTSPPACAFCGASVIGDANLCEACTDVSEPFGHYVLRDLAHSWFHREAVYERQPFNSRSK